jgi:hypothetical protein
MLNKDITLALLEYWTPEDLGKMAQINRGWKTLIYRDEIWNRFNWNIGTPSRFLKITDESHHFGNKQNACFWNWFLYHYSGSLDTQPLYMMSYKQQYGKWLQAGKPCYVLTHHDPRSCFIYQFTESEKDHLIQSSVVHGSSGKGDGIPMNSYYRYLSNQILDKILPQYSSYIKLDISKCKTQVLYLSSTATTTTVPTIPGLETEFRKKCAIIDLNRLENMLEEYEKSSIIVTAAKKALGRISREIFAQNQRIIQQANHPVWNSILWNLPM